MWHQGILMQDPAGVFVKSVFACDSVLVFQVTHFNLTGADGSVKESLTLFQNNTGWER